MAKKGKDKKKGDGELEKEMKLILTRDIEILESKIFLEQEKEVEAKTFLAKNLKEMERDQQEIGQFKIEGGKKINNANENMKKDITGFVSQISDLEKEIRDYDDQIKTLEKTLVILDEDFTRELAEKDADLAKQRKSFEEMSVRFQHILHKTAEKLQERVNMGA